MKPLRFLPEALEEMYSAADWYDRRELGLGDDFLQKAESAARKAAADPKRWPHRSLRTQRVLLERFPYSVVYTEMPDAVWVIAVPHGKQRPYYWMDRLTKLPM